MRFSSRFAIFTFICLSVMCVFINDLTAAPLDKIEDKSQQKPPHLIPNAVNLVKYENVKIGIDGYDFAFETSDGVSRKETATVKNLGTEEEAISVEGAVSWLGPDGIQYTLKYIADENGFQPEGKHLPVVLDT